MCIIQYIIQDIMIIDMFVLLSVKHAFPVWRFRKAT